MQFSYLRQSFMTDPMKQIVLEADNEDDLQLLLHLADRLNIRHSSPLPLSNLSDDQYAKLRQRILDYSGDQPSSFGDAIEWQRQTREDRPSPWQAR